MSGDTSVWVGVGGDKWNVGVAALMAARQERFMCHFRFEHRMLSQIFNASTGRREGVGRGKGWLLVCASEMATLHTHTHTRVTDTETETETSLCGQQQQQQPETVDRMSTQAST